MAARPAAFARCWTRKEAYLKGTGTGLNTAPATVLAGAGPRPARIPGWRVTDLATLPGYAASVATREPQEPHGAQEAHEAHDALDHENLPDGEGPG
ncbi:4'-phosphopantetheinyl transferase superfamily protein [Streptomyces sp. MS1.HAVA.3]|uniref:4'-phosphopantetheinyl transferase superfamily protein n=1 Tax=Streptomyces caledonius TaxID=3134107 RepID=A0ABU8U7N3_9ACTN